MNDHVLKSRWPGLVTGKLSDVAGVTMVAIVVATLTGRVDLGLISTAVGFSVLKTVPLAAEWAAPVLGGITRTDPSDLVALLALVPLRWWLRSSVLDDASERGPASAFVRVLLVGAAVFATSATSCDSKGVFAVSGRDGVLRAGTSEGDYVSTDGGATWQDRPEQPELDWNNIESVTNVCVDTVCYRAEHLNQLTEISSGSETPVLRLDPVQQDEISRLGNAKCGCDAFSTIAAADLDGQRHVVVSMGPAGALRRDPDGTWHWVRIGRWGPPADADDAFLGLPVADP